jgi:hypothetical protein
MFRRLSLLVVAVLLFLTASACVGFIGPGRLSHDLADELDWKLDREMGLTVRRSALWFARAVMPEDDEESEEISAMLKGVRRVQVGVYEVEPRKNGTQDATLCNHPFESWTQMVRVCDEDEQVVLLTPDLDDLREMIVLTREGNELVVVYLKGNLEMAFENAIMIASRDSSEGKYEPRPDCDRWDEQSRELIACQDPLGAREALHDLTRPYEASSSTP